ncbi:hypothetical protein F4780DRAFT_564327 [Xylariomycetidae sp. FL0641]|nr:hypothetical protein F4780DRAFT_564327 [Xylariomycetidae sp. FL0641]
MRWISVSRSQRVSSMVFPDLFFFLCSVVRTLDRPSVFSFVPRGSSWLGKVKYACKVGMSSFWPACASASEPSVRKCPGGGRAWDPRYRGCAGMRGLISSSSLSFDRWSSSSSSSAARRYVMYPHATWELAAPPISAWEARPEMGEPGGAGATPARSRWREARFARTRSRRAALRSAYSSAANEMTVKRTTKRLQNSAFSTGVNTYTPYVTSIRYFFSRAHRTSASAREDVGVALYGLS